MRFDLRHPSDPDLRAVYGFDNAVEFFVTIFKKRRVVAEYDCLRPPYDGIPGVLALLVQHGFLDEDDIALAGQELAHRGPGEIEDRDVRRAATVIENLRAAAADEG